MSDLVQRLREGKSPQPSDLPVLKEVLASPEFKDSFKPELRQSLEGFLQGVPATRDVEHLLPDLTRVDNAQELPQRFASDYQLVRDQLFDRPGIGPMERAQRAMEFLGAYAQRFAELAHPLGAKKETQVRISQMREEEAPHAPEMGTAPVERSASAVAARAAREVAPTSLVERALQGLAHQSPQGPLEVKEEIRRFVEVLRELGFAQLVERTTGEDGLRFAQRLLSAKSPQEVAELLNARQFGASHFPPAPRELLATGEWKAPPKPVPHEGPELAVAPGGKGVSEGARPDESWASLLPGEESPVPSALERRLLPPARLNGLDREPGNQVEGDHGRGRYTSKRLGPQLLWNILHRYRTPPEEAGAKQGPLSWDRATVLTVVVLVVVSVLVALLASF